MARPNLDHLLLQDIQVGDVELGAGAYGRVFEVEYAGLACAAKEIHPIFFRVARREELERIKVNFLHECQVWSTLRHPNIVQFIGVHYPAGDQSGLPIMVMEKMSCSLRSLVERYGENKISLCLKLSILHDTTLGLWYLHIRHPPIVHRDLTPNNILVGSHLEAKITDLGVAKVIKDTDSGRKMTKAPGTPHFMPPEALDDNPIYDTSLDIFSYGAVTLYVITQQWPEPMARERFNPATGSRELVSEIERRQEYLDMFTVSALNAELRPLVLSCLDDDSTKRPKVADVSKIMKQIKELHCKEVDVLLSDLPPKVRIEEQTPHIQLQQSSDKEVTTLPNHTDETIKITWKEGPPAPVKLCSCTSVYLNDVIYVAGYGGRKSTAFKIYSFNPAKNLWQPSIKTQHCFFSLTTIQEKLVIVGGTCKVPWHSFNLKATNKLFVLDAELSKWQEYSQMSVSRALATAVSHGDMLIVTGGYSLYNKILSSTEVLNITTTQWFTCGDLPQPHYQLQSAIVNGQLYLLGGVNQDGNSPAVFTASLDTLSECQLNWKPMHDTTWRRSGVTSMFGTGLLVIGGRDRLHRTSSMYTFDNNSHSWKVISQIPEARSSPCVATTNDNVIVVIGGKKNYKTKQEGKASNIVWFGSLITTD